MKKFTLIELIIVIAIIGILSSLLLPALSKARTKARQAVCLSMQKQLNISFTIYVTDYNGYGPGGSTRWMSVLGVSENKNSLGGSADLECPEGTKLTADNFWGTNFAMNNNITNNWSGEPSKNIKQATPSKTVVTMDSYKIFKGAFASWVASPQLTEGPLSDNIARHDFKANLIFLDGSGKAKSASYLLSKND